MTPSEAHDSAWQRGTDHDAMAIALRNIFEKNAAPVMVKENEYRFAGAWCEVLRPSGRGHWFADLWVRWSASFKKYDSATEETDHNLYGIFEIKPKIYSAGALMRQLAVQNERIQAWKESLSYELSSTTTVFVEAAVRKDDPLLAQFLELSRSEATVWDGAETIARVSYCKGGRS